jgi:hypothetical protein
MKQSNNYFGEVVTLWGRNNALAVTLENLYEGSVLSNWAAIGDAAYKLQVVSASANDTVAGTGARTLRIGGLDANYDPIEEVVNLNGTTAVETVNSFLRVFYAEVLSAGTGITNAGAINVVKTGTSAGVTHLWVQIPIGLNASTSGLFTVPRGGRYKLKSVTLSARTQQVDVFLFSQEAGETLRQIESYTVGGPNTVFVNHMCPSGFLFLEKEDIFMRASSATAAGVVSMSVELKREGPGGTY